MTELALWAIPGLNEEIKPVKKLNSIKKNCPKSEQKHEPQLRAELCMHGQNPSVRILHYLT